MDAIDKGQMSEDAWLVLRSMHYSPERDTLASIAIGPLVLGVGDDGVAGGLRELEAHGYVTETAGRWRLTERVPQRARRGCSPARAALACLRARRQARAQAPRARPALSYIR